VPDFAARRAPFREAHLRLLRDANSRGLLLFPGPLGDPPDGALLVFRAVGGAGRRLRAPIPTSPKGWSRLARAPWNIVTAASLSSRAL
jgi:hypothetical protein